MSSFIVSARKYRPVRFDEVVGQEHVVRTLKNAIQKDQLAHAFLFCGPRGVGKTSCARILAKTVNCSNREATGEACGTCTNCITFAEQQTFNIIELDAASYNSVDHIRTLNEQVRFQPQQGQYKVFIIDEVHMLSQSAFNAFLKTLEEPPPYAIFILATTEKHKILPTILSRCQIFDFKRIPIPQIVDHLKHIGSHDKVQAEDEALHIIAQKAEGSLRDALSIYDRMVSFTDGELTYQNTIANLNVLDYDYYFQFVDHFMLQDQASVLLLFDQVIRNGFEPDLFLLGLAEHLRMLWVSKDSKTQGLLEVSSKLKERYIQQSLAVGRTFLASALQVLNECDIAYPRAKNKRLHVEMALLKITYIQNIQEIFPSLSEANTAQKKSPDSSESGSTLVYDLPPDNNLEEVEAKGNHAHNVSSTADNEPGLSPDHDSVSQEPSGPALLPQVNTPSESKKSVDTPKLTSLAAIQNLVMESEVAEEDILPLDDATLQELWTEYTEEVTSPSLTKVLQDVELKLDAPNNVLTVVVGTQFAKGVIMQESELIERIRERTQTLDLQMIIDIDTSRAPEDLYSNRKILTNKEKYDLMCDSNPLLRTFTEKYELKIDHSA